MSWPVTKGDGVLLGYGVEGKVLYLANSSKNKLIFAKERESNVVLYPFQDKFQTIIPAQAKTDLAPLRKDTEAFIQKINIPKSELKNLQAESDHLLSNNVYDPAVKQLMTVGKIRTRGKYSFTKVLASKGGRLGTLLNISTIGIDLTSHDISLLSKFSISFPSQIKQISFCELSETFGQVASPYVLVRTESVIYILKLRVDSFNHQDIILKHEITLENRIADMSINPWDFAQFSVIDVEGNCSIYEIPDGDLNIKTLIPTFSICNPAEFSGFKVVVWGRNSKSLFLVDRSIIKHVDLSTMEMNTLLVLHSFSSIRHLTRINDQHMMLLTSREVILLEFNEMNLNKIISWKHLLDKEDCTLKLVVTDFTKINNGVLLYHCSIISSCNKMLFQIQFGLKDGFWKILGDPDLLLLEHDDQSVSDVAIVPFIESDLQQLNKKKLSLREENVSSIDEKCFTIIFSFSKSYELKWKMFSTVLQEINSPPSDQMEEHQIQMPSITRFSEKLQGLFAKMSLSDDEDEVMIGTQSDEVQNAAFALSSQLNTYVEDKNLGVGTLWLSADVISKITDIDELDSMLEQLMNHFTENGLVFSFSFPLLSEKSRNLQLPIGSVYDWLKQFSIANELYFRQISTQLALSLITFKTSTVSDKEELTEMMKEFPEEMQAVFSGWGNDEELEEDDVLDTFDVPSSFLMPSIKVSQRVPNVPVDPTKFATQRPKLPESQSSQESTQPINALSQIERGVFGGRPAKLKKKKKRMGGFA